jgi:hypothetical protein
MPPPETFMSKASAHSVSRAPAPSSMALISRLSLDFVPRSSIFAVSAGSTGFSGDVMTPAVKSPWSATVGTAWFSTIATVMPFGSTRWRVRSAKSPPEERVSV